MRVFTYIFLFLTVAVGCAAFRGSGESAEFLKLLYAYLALTTVVCSLITMAARKPAPKSAPASIQLAGPS
jgi:hypothetical protein